MLVFSNRNFIQEQGSFGNELSETLSIAHGEKKGSTWTCSLIQNGVIDLTSFANGKPLVLFTHGYNMGAHEALDMGEYIGEKNDVSVICFLWSSKGEIVDYFKDRKIADLSAKTFAICLDILKQQMSGTTLKMSAIFHSMGNHLFKHFLTSNKENYARCNFLNRVSLVSADVKALDSWCHLLPTEVYIVVNEKDYALEGSKILHGDNRLGDQHPVRDEDKKNVTLIDLTGVAGDTHDPFYSENAKVNQIFFRLLNGEKAEEGLEPILNVPDAYQVVSHESYCIIL